MESKELEYQNAGKFAWFAARDARMRSYENASLYTESEKNRAERMRMGLTLVYAGKEFHIEYRKKFISLKIDKPAVRDRKNLALLESDYTVLGVVKRVTNQGITYRIPKI
jgi:hypothetical protein